MCVCVSVCVRACVRATVRACVRACVRVCVRDTQRGTTDSDCKKRSIFFQLAPEVLDAFDSGCGLEDCPRVSVGQRL